MLKQKYFLTGIFILSAERQPIKLSWRKIVWLRKSSATIVEKGKFVYAGDNIILVDGENSGEVFTVPQDGYVGSTFKQLWLSSAMWKPYILAFILFYKEELRNSKRGAAIPHLNKELFYNLLIGIPPLAEQQRIAERVNELSQLLK